MKIYLRKIDYQCINKQISYTHEVLEDFLDNLGDHDYIKCIGMKSGKEENVQLLLATDPRFNNSIKNILKEEGKLEEGDLMAMYKQRDSYLVELIKPNDDRYDKYMSLFGKDRHAIIHMDDETPSNEVDYNTCNIYGMHVKLANNCLDKIKPHVCIGWSCLGDLTNADESYISALYDQKMGNVNNNRRGQDLSQINTFVLELKKNDIVIFFDGNTRKASFGMIDSNYYYEEQDGVNQDFDYVNNKGIHWIKHVKYDDLPEAIRSTSSTQKSIWHMDKYRHIINEILNNECNKDMSDEAISVDPYSKEDFLNDVFMNEDEYETLKELLEYKKNIILQGAPGVGKTYLAKRFIYSLIGSKDNSKIEFVQFHQNYSYEDFIMGYRPNETGFELKEGVFYKFCKKASESTEPHYFIIDEINRGNVSKIFGELMMLIEADKRGESAKLVYNDEQFSIPPNLYIIGMMNTADRSLAMIDYALRRRFSFYDVKPAFGNDKFRMHLLNNGLSNVMVDKIVNKFNALNKFIADEKVSGLGKGFQIGHSYFCVKPQVNEDKFYENIIKYEIAPILKEYWYDDLDTANNKIRELNE